MSKKLYSFFRPHEPFIYRNERFDALTGEFVVDPSRTETHHKDACDINNIVRRMKPHEIQQLIQANAAAGMYVDLPDELDYQASIAAVRRAEASFMSLPSKVRERFGNDPALFVTFATNPQNISELRELGLASPSLPAAVPPSPPPQPPSQPAQAQISSPAPSQTPNPNPTQ